MPLETSQMLHDLGRSTIEGLETERGILASGRDELFGCIFGRDSLISALLLLHAYERARDPYYLRLTKKILWNLGELQGTDTTIESGEEPGKIVHEYRPDKHERLTVAGETGPAWYVYPDGAMRNYDSVDSTPLFLMAAHEYWRLSADSDFIEALMPRIRAALEWVLDYGDSDGDGFIDYQFRPARVFGGLKVQSWMDSAESIFFEDSAETPIYPIAPVEVQAYCYAALASWSRYLEASDTALSHRLADYARALKIRFNSEFVIEKGGRTALAFARDGARRPLTALRSSMGHVLWAQNKRSEPDAPDIPDTIDTILDARHIPAIVELLLAPDLYEPEAGIRTLSSNSSRFQSNSYHNGSIWPHDSAIVAQGLDNAGYVDAAAAVRASLIKAYLHFKTPLELFTYQDGAFGEYRDAAGHGACRTQAWSAAALLSILPVAN